MTTHVLLYNAVTVNSSRKYGSYVAGCYRTKKCTQLVQYHQHGHVDVMREQQWVTVADYIILCLPLTYTVSSILDWLVIEISSAKSSISQSS